MSVSGVNLPSLFSTQSLQSTNIQKAQQEFQQLGTDLGSGNLSAAKKDFATLQSLAPQSASTLAQSNNPVAAALKQLGEDLQSGNLSAAQKDYSNIRRHFRHSGVERRQDGDGDGNSVNSLFQQLGTALQSGNLPSAQQAYNSLAQQLQQNLLATTGALPPTTAAPATPVSVSA